MHETGRRETCQHASMGFFQKLFGLKPSNPTESFPRRLVPPQLIWDITSWTLTGIPLPSPVEALVPLGPSDAFRSLGPNLGVLSFQALGLEVEVVLGKVQHFTLIISESSPPTIPPANSSASRSTTITSELRTAVGDPLAHARGYSVHRSPFHSLTLTLVATACIVHRSTRSRSWLQCSPFTDY